MTQGFSACCRVVSCPSCTPTKLQRLTISKSRWTSKRKEDATLSHSYSTQLDREVNMSEAVNIAPRSSGSPLSLSPSSSASGSPLQLDPSTLALLDQFLTEKTEAEEKFAKLEEAAHARLVAAQNGEEHGEEQGEETKMISVDEFREMFGEDWQLSQFW